MDSRGALLPFTSHRQDLVRDPADCAVRDGNAVNLLNVCFNVPCRHPLGVHGQDFLFNVLANAGLVFLQYLRLKFTLAVSGNRHLHVAETGTQSLAVLINDEMVLVQRVALVADGRIYPHVLPVFGAGFLTAFTFLLVSWL